MSQEIIRKLPNFVFTKATSLLDKLYLPLDKRVMLRAKNLRLVPERAHRRGGKVSYGEWCHTIGVFQTVLHTHLVEKTNNSILDVGCGTGLIGIASEPFVLEHGSYIGIDVSKKNIEFCRKQFPKDYFQFQHLDTQNLTYAPDQSAEQIQWEIADNSIDVVTALSVWTHMNKDDAVFYFCEINRVLKPNGIAVITFFLLDDTYDNSLRLRSDNVGRYHNTHQNTWVFDVALPGTSNWFHPSWTKQPEDAIGITPDGIQLLQQNTDLSVVATYQGNWKEIPGIFFQDVLVFKKNGSS